MQVSSKVEWLLRVPQIREELAALETPVVNRAVIERVFRLKRRRSIELMHSFGGFQSGRTFLIDRQQLLRKLEEIEASDEFERAFCRRERLSETLEKLRRQRVAERVVIPVSREIFEHKLAGLPAGIELKPGVLTVEYAKAVDLLQKLFTLVQAIANDFERFESLGGQTAS